MIIYENEVFILLLSLLVTSSQSAALGTACRKKFNELGGTIGRGKDKDWVLPDPNHHISSNHAIIEFKEGAYYIIDVSTNGVYINDNRDPIGKNNRVELKKGDYIYIGEYEISADFEEEHAAISDATAKEGPFFDEISGEIPADMDPLDLFDSKKSIETVNSTDLQNEMKEEPVSEEADAYLIDHSPSLDEFFEPPSVSQEKNIPDDWNATGFTSAHSAENMEEIPDDWELTGFLIGKPKKEHINKNIDEKGKPEHKVPSTVAEPGIIKQNDNQIEPDLPPTRRYEHQEKVVTSKPAMVSQTYDTEVLLRSIGLDISGIPPEIIKELPEMIGIVFREFVQGIMEALTVRTNLKSAFRVNQTMIGPTENNPLKFSVNVDGALENMLLKRGVGFLPALEAVQEGFNDIKAHQVATMAGMQGALKGVLERFNPEELEERFTIGPKGSKLLSAYNKARFWDRYKELYEDIVMEAMDNFQNLLGEEFALAYEDQIKKVDDAGQKLSKKD